MHYFDSYIIWFSIVTSYYSVLSIKTIQRELKIV